MTEEELVTHLNRAGTAVTRRRVMSWREKGLLPDFDVRGRGRGRGRGRAFSYWNNAERVTSQASTILELLRWRDRAEDAFFPLWLLGHRVPEEAVRRKLREQIVSALELLAVKDTQYESREDTLFAMAGALYDNWRREQNSEVPALESIDLVFQIVGNLDYVPDDPLSADLQFVKDYLSLAALDESVRSATSEEISQLQRDFGVLADVARQVFSVLPRLPFDLPNKYGLLSLVGQLIVMFDLACRRAGHGPDIDYLLSTARANLPKLREAYAERHLVEEA